MSVCLLVTFIGKQLNLLFGNMSGGTWSTKSLTSDQQHHFMLTDGGGGGLFLFSGMLEQCCRHKRDNPVHIEWRRQHCSNIPTQTPLKFQNILQPQNVYANFSTIYKKIQWYSTPNNSLVFQLIDFHTTNHQSMEIVRRTNENQKISCPFSNNNWNFNC